MKRYGEVLREVSMDFSGERFEWVLLARERVRYWRGGGEVAVAPLGWPEGGQRQECRQVNILCSVV